MSEEVLSIKEEERISPEDLLAREKESIRKSSYWEIGLGTLVVAAHFALFAYLHGYGQEYNDEFGEPLSWKLLFRSIFFVFGLIAIIVGIWGLYRSRHLTLEEIVPSAAAIEFLRESENVTPYYTYTLLGCIIAVTVVQMITGLDESIPVAGLVKQDFVARGEYWRLLTAATLHGGFLHIYFNAQALYGIGQMIEQVSNQAHLSIVFLLAIFGGSICSLVFMPSGLPSVGASGGILGLIGYLAVFGRRRQHHLPPGFFKNVLISIALTGAIGVIGYQFIDNFAHLGGLIVGAVYGLVQIPREPERDVRGAGTLLSITGGAALAVFVFACAFSILLLLQIVSHSGFSN